MSNFLVFALIGLFVGAAARLFYPGRQPLHILGTMVLGMLGALAGGMLSRNFAPAEDGEFLAANLFMSIIGAIIVIVFWTVVAYARSVSGKR
jgi:uncharacterized membrane protein YeaQ/YmgE (transglycosylase-associated protein family)